MLSVYVPKMQHVILFCSIKLALLSQPNILKTVSGKLSMFNIVGYRCNSRVCIHYERNYRHQKVQS